MTTEADFTADEWQTVLSGPPSAGLLVSAAQRGGTFRESFSMAKAYTESRQMHGESELLDAIVSAKPRLDRTRQGSADEFKQHHLKLLDDAVALVQSNATADELEAYKRFVAGLCERVAEAKDEGDDPVSEAELGAIAEVSEVLGPNPG